MKISIELGPKTVKCITSPLWYVVCALTGVSMTFCLEEIYRCGREGTNIFDPWLFLNIGAIWLVHGFFQAVAIPVICQVREQTTREWFRAE